MRITHRIYEDGSRVCCEQLALEAACQSMLDRPFPPSRPCHVPWYTREGKSAAFTLAQLRRWKVIRNPNGTIIGVDRDRPKATRITKRQYDDVVRRLAEVEKALRDCAAYMAGKHRDASVIERARQIAA